MITSKKVYGKAMSMPAGIGMGIGVNLILIIIGCAIIAKMMEASIIELDNLGYGAMIVLLISSYAGASIAAALVKRQKLLVCMIECVASFAILLLLNGLLYGGEPNGIGVTALLLLGGTCAALLIGTHVSGKKKPKFKK